MTQLRRVFALAHGAPDPGVGVFVEGGGAVGCRAAVVFAQLLFGVLLPTFVVYVTEARGRAAWLHRERAALAARRAAAAAAARAAADDAAAAAAAGGGEPWARPAAAGRTGGVSTSAAAAADAAAAAAAAAYAAAEAAAAAAADGMRSEVGAPLAVPSCTDVYVLVALTVGAWAAVSAWGGA
ncbi:MAG: hypothetical protein J3K34DRAFT_525071 [Monoraphidium minutum]|nr:MAG: hypothetical protein J3K34DRAFT_525071 [Monoraphidium minutum]